MYVIDEDSTEKDTQTAYSGPITERRRSLQATCRLLLRSV